MRLHVVVRELETARAAIDGGATVVQLRLKGQPTGEVAERGLAFRDLCRTGGATFVVNDDVEAALRLGADGVHLGQSDEGAERAAAEGLLLGISAATAGEANRAVEQHASYIGAGPVWPTPSKEDAAPPIGLDGLAALGELPIPVIAIGGIDASNAADCIRAGADGVAVVRAAHDARVILEAIDGALTAR